jgi:hypothetical protein
MAKKKTYVREGLSKELITSDDCGCIYVVNKHGNTDIPRRLIGCNNMTDEMVDLIHSTYCFGIPWH